MMDVTLRSSSTKRVSKLRNNSLPVTKENILEQKKKNRRLSLISVSDKGVLDDKQIKRCSVILQRISDNDLKKYLSGNSKPKLSKSELQASPKAVIKVEMPSGIVENMEPKWNAETRFNIDPKFIATEEHLDLLMAKQMITTNIQIKQRQIMNNVVRNSNSHKRNYENMNSGHKNPDKINYGNVHRISMDPVVKLERLTSQFISAAVNGKYEKECIDEIVEVKKKRIYKKRRPTPGVERRRSQRSSVLKSSCSCCSGSTSSINKIYDNEEKSSKLKKNMSRKKDQINYSSDDDDFFGFELHDRNKRRTNIMKKALKKLCTQATVKELTLWKKEVKKKEIMKKENEKFNIQMLDMKKHLRHKAPLKVINRIDTINRVSENVSIFKDEKVREPRVRRGFNLHDIGRDFEVEVFTRDENDAEAAGLPVDKLEILKLFQQREESKELINRLAKDKRKYKTRKSVDDAILVTSEIDYTSDECFLKKGRKRVPLWAEEDIREAIMLSQEEIPHPFIAEYFRTPKMLSVERLFPEKCDKYLK